MDFDKDYSFAIEYELSLITKVVIKYQYIYKT